MVLDSAGCQTHNVMIAAESAPEMSRGRPREFDRDDALRRAMLVFWQRGYQDTSISALTEELGIASTSLYAAFGSKAALFCQAADLYQAEDAALPTRELDGGTTARESIERMLRANADMFTRRGGPRGCLLTLAASTGSGAGTTVRRYIERSCRERLRNIERRLVRADEAGEVLPATPIELAELYDALVQGMAVRAHEGATRRSLHRTVDLAMRTWE
jgi:AcrR family transcriptional regulator